MAVTNEKHHTAGQTFMQAVLAKLPEAKRAQAAAIFTGEDVDPVIETLGEGAMLRGDYSKAHNELGTREAEIQTHWTRLNTWYAGKKGDLEKADALQAKINELEAAGAGAGDGTGDGGPPAGDGKPNGNAPPMTKDALLKTLGLDPTQMVTREQLAQAINTTERGMLAFYNEADPLAVEHFKTFGEVLDTSSVFGHPKIQELGFKACYLDLHKDKFETLATKQQEEHDKKIADAAVADYQKENAGAGFPIPGRTMPSGHQSPLDALEASMRTPAPTQLNPDGTPKVPDTAPGPGHTNLADDNAIVDRAVEQFLTRAQELGRPVARI